MTIYSHLSAKDVNDIGSEYNLGKIISVEPLSGGSENSNYVLISDKGKYVLSICEQKSVEEADQLAQLLEHLFKNDYHTSRIIRNRNNGITSLWKGKPLLLKSFIEGNIIKELSPDLLKLIGIELGRLHLINPPEYLPEKLSYGKESFDQVKEYAAGSSFDTWLENILEYLTPYLKLDLPKSLIHGDVFWNNVIVSEDHQAAIIMDFEEASHYYRVFDLGMTIIGTCGDVNKISIKKAGQLMNGYIQVVELTDAEILSLKAFTVYAGASMTFWRHKNFNYTNPIPGMSDHYLGLKIITDYVVDLDEDCFSSLIN